MDNILDKITTQTRSDLSKRKREISFRDLNSLPMFDKKSRDFKSAIHKSDQISIIAEVKKASPSKGVIRDDFEPLKIASQYIENGASAISVLTDEPFFNGSLKYLELISDMSSIPILRKDFIVDTYQVKEAKAYGADAVLLIVSMYSGNQLHELIAACREFGLFSLVECYHEDELQSIHWDEVEIVGVNNRNLATFDVDVRRGVELLKQAPNHIVKVSESGIYKPEDLLLLYENGIDSALIGEYLMKQPDIGMALKILLSEFQSLKKGV